MKKSIYTQWDKLFEENRYLKLALLGVTILATIEVLIIYKISNEKTTILVPTNMTSTYEASGSKISNGYFKDVGYQLANLILTVSPSNVEENFQSILPYIFEDPNTIHKMNQILMEQAQTIKDNDVYQAFYPGRVNVFPKQRKFTVEGMLRRTNATSVMSTTKATITYDFVVNENSKIRITNIGIKQ